MEGTSNRDRAGVLRFDFGEKDARLEPISRGEFFQEFVRLARG